MIALEKKDSLYRHLSGNIADGSTEVTYATWKENSLIDILIEHLWKSTNPSISQEIRSSESSTTRPSFNFYKG